MEKALCCHLFPIAKKVFEHFFKPGSTMDTHRGSDLDMWQINKLQTSNTFYFFCISGSKKVEKTRARSKRSCSRTAVPPKVLHGSRHGHKARCFAGMCVWRWQRLRGGTGGFITQRKVLLLKSALTLLTVTWVLFSNDLDFLLQYIFEVQ